MSDERSSLTNRIASPEEAARESRHEVLGELLGAYADRELPPETVAQIDAHLVGCAECRRGLEVHDTLRARLAVQPPAAASPAFRAGSPPRSTPHPLLPLRGRLPTPVSHPARVSSGSPSQVGPPRLSSPSPLPSPRG